MSRLQLSDEELHKNYLNKVDACQYLEIKKDFLVKCVKEGYLNSYYKFNKNREMYYKKSELEILRKKSNDFHQNYYTFAECYQFISKNKLHLIKRNGIPPYARNGKFHAQLYSINCEELKRFIDQGKHLRKLDISIKDLDDYYITNDAIDLLGLSKDIFKKLCKQEKIRFYAMGSYTYYNKYDINRLKTIQEEKIKEHEGFITRKEALRKYPQNIVVAATKYPIDLYLKRTYKSGYVLYRESELIAENQKYEPFREMYNVVGNNPSEIINKKLDAYKSSENIDFPKFENESPFTSSKWYIFICLKLEKSNACTQSINAYGNRFVYCTQYIVELLNTYKNNEIFYCKTSEIIEFIGTIPISYTIIIKDFLSYIYSEIKNDLIKFNLNDKKLFNIKQINRYVYNLTNKPKDLVSADIYLTHEFIECINYSMNLNLHITKGLKEIEKTSKVNYISTWLYVLIHLNNGWRNGDVVEFNDIQINDLLEFFKINDIQWFKLNILTLEQARLITSRIINRNFILSKTQAKGYFFCSDDLSIPIASAIIILHFQKRYNAKILEHLTTNLMEFYTKYNEPTISQLRKYFEEINLVNFVFKSRKMNCTLLSYIYSITIEEDSNKALQFAQKVRAHKDIASTLHYVHIEKMDIQFLSSQLFERGEFGYIYELINNRINNKKQSTLSLEEKTSQIKVIKATLKNMVNVEIIGGFLNGYAKEKNEITTEINNKSFIELSDILYKIHIQSMPSKEIHIQCLISGKCNKVDKNISCRYCAYAIPNLYALNDICQNAVCNLNDYHNENVKGKQIKLSVKINHDLELLSQAISLYGKELVYSFMNISRENYYDQVIRVKEPIDIRLNNKLKC